MRLTSGCPLHFNVKNLSQSRYWLRERFFVGCTKENQICASSTDLVSGRPEVDPYTAPSLECVGAVINRPPYRTSLIENG